MACFIHYDDPALTLCIDVNIKSSEGMPLTVSVPEIPEIQAQLNNSVYGLSALNTQINELKNNSASKTDVINLQTTINSLQESMAPTIISIKGRNGATATKGTFSLDVTASNATHFKAVTSVGDTDWQESPNINNISLAPGVNTIEVQARRGASEEAPITKGYITIFKL